MPLAPKPDSKRRRANKPLSYGLADPVTASVAAEQPELGFDAHPMVVDMWSALGRSVEGKFFSDGDWVRARWEMWNANSLFTGERMVSASTWASVQHGLSELLVSPADKRRAGIELKAAVDPDEDAAVLQIARYQDKLSK